MRKNNVRFKNLRLFSVYKVSGKPVRPLINYCASQKITLYNLKFTDERTAEFWVKFRDDKKFFAISKDLCYNNIIKVKSGGVLYPLFAITKRLGLLLGAFLFTVIATLFNGVVLSVEYYGSGADRGAEVGEFLEEIGVKKFSLFSSFSLKELEDKIALSNDNISFASAEKCGNVLKIRLESADGEVKKVESVNRLISSEDGVIESIKVYSGTALKAAGDSVKKGDTIVDGYAEIKEQRVNVEVIATVTLIVKKEFVYTSEKENEEEYAESLAIESLGIKIKSANTTAHKKGEKYEYITEIEYRLVI